MRPRQATAILVYGTSQTQTAKAKTSLPVIDVSQPDWRDDIDEDTKDPVYLTTSQAYMVARKRLPSHRVERIDSLDGLTESGEDTGPRRAAARIGDIVVTKRYHPAVEESKAWLSTYHLGLIKELFGEGFVVEILDENNNPITVLGEKE